VLWLDDKLILNVHVDNINIDNVDKELCFKLGFLSVLKMLSLRSH